MIMRSERFETLVNQRVSDLKQLKRRKEAEVRKEKLSHEDHMNEESMRRAALNEENRVGARNCMIMEAKLEMRNREEKAGRKKLCWDLNVGISLQHSTIQQLIEQRQLARVDELLRIRLSLAQSEHRECLKELQTQLEACQEHKYVETWMLIDQMERILAEEQEKNDSLIEGESKKVLEALDLLVAAKTAREAQLTKEWENWMVLRGKVVKSNVDLMQVFEDQCSMRKKGIGTFCEGI
jgi:hypothetical protein